MKYLFPPRRAIQFSAHSAFNNPSTPSPILDFIMYIFVANIAFVEIFNKMFPDSFFSLPRVNEDDALNLIASCNIESSVDIICRKSLVTSHTAGAKE